MTTDTTPGSLRELQDLIHEKYGIDRADLGPEASMRDKGFDSLALVEFLFAVEDHFKISLPDTDENMTTLGQLATLVDELLAKKAAGGSPAGVAAGAAVAPLAPVVAPAVVAPEIVAPEVVAPAAVAPAAAVPPATPPAAAGPAPVEPVATNHKPSA